MTDLVCDGSFDGALCGAARVHELPGACLVAAREAAPELFADTVHVPTDPARAAAIARTVVSCAGEGELETLRYLHASAAPDRYRLLAAYLGRTLAERRPIAGDAADPVVRAVRAIRDRVSLEIARFLGFARFRRVGGDRYYAPVNPDADIVGFLGPHFAARFPGQSIVIHDVRRDIAFWSSRGACGIVDLAGLPASARERLAADSEPEVEDLWRAFFAQAGNPERRNGRLQRKLLPARYRPLMTECGVRDRAAPHAAVQSPKK